MSQESEPNMNVIGRPSPFVNKLNHSALLAIAIISAIGNDEMVKKIDAHGFASTLNDLR